MGLIMIKKKKVIRLISMFIVKREAERAHAGEMYLSVFKIEEESLIDAAP